jgi:hypothetical protein
MSSTSGGPEWWQASDNKWYPPELHPDRLRPSETASEQSANVVTATLAERERPDATPEAQAPVRLFSSADHSSNSSNDGEAVAQQPAAEVGRIRFALRNYDGGLPLHPTPESAGFLILTNEKRFELRFAGKAQVWQFLLGRYPLSFTRTGPQSCRVLVRDNRDPSVVTAFDLPDTSYEALADALDTLDVPFRCLSAVAEYSPWVA